MSSAYGYVRQSRRADLATALSEANQMASIYRLAARDGLAPDQVTVLKDMGRSGGAGKERLRDGYQALLEAIDSGGVEVIYSVSMSRVARSTVELQAFYARCLAAGVKVVYEKEQIDFRTASGKMHAQVLAAFYEFERDLAVERARDNVATRRANGEVMGRRPYGEAEGQDPALVVAAFDRAKSYNGAATILNADGIPTSLGRLWTSTAVRLVIERHAPDKIIRGPKQGLSAGAGAGGFVLSRLLRCACGGSFLTGRRGHKQSPRYHCHRADANAAHSRPHSVLEAPVLAYIRERVDALRIEGDRVRLDANTAERRAGLEERRLRVLDMYEMGADKAEVTARLAAIDKELDELADLDAFAPLAVLPKIDWTWPAADLNALLRKLIIEVEMDAQMRPAGITWRGRIADWDRD